MKTRIWQNVLVATLLALTLTASRAAEADDVKPDKNAPPPAPNVVAPPTNAPAPIAPAQVLQLPKPSLPPLLDQVVRLKQSGADENVVRAYVEKAAPPYQVTGNEIIQLQELGVSKGVILALIEHSKSVTSTGNTTPAVTEPAPQPPQTSVNGTATPSDAVNDYRDALSPYGAWLDVPGYGWSWQPTVVVVNPSWRPYCDNGDWTWTDSGWYWRSYYSWGWAPFHYGRWYSHPSSGWLWCPDREWGPAWVSWRNSATYCGWAPLPPGACFSASLGWTFHGASVGLGFGFGLGAAHFTFVAHDRFSERHVGGHSLRGHEVGTVYRNTSVVNNYAVGANNRVINRGIGRETIAAAARTPIREASVQNLTQAGNRSTAANGVNRIGSPIQRSTASTFVSHNGRVINTSSRQFTAQRSAASSPGVNSGASSRAVIAGGNTPQRSVPTYSRNYPNAGQSVQPSRSANATVGRSASAPTYQTPRYSMPAARPQSVQRSMAPSTRAVASAPRYTPRSFGSVARGGTAVRGGHSSGGNMSGRAFAARR